MALGVSLIPHLWPANYLEEDQPAVQMAAELVNLLELLIDLYSEFCWVIIFPHPFSKQFGKKGNLKRSILLSPQL